MSKECLHELAAECYIEVKGLFKPSAYMSAVDIVLVFNFGKGLDYPFEVSSND